MESRTTPGATPRLADLPPPPPGRTGWPWDVETPPPAPEDSRDWPSIGVVTPSFNQGQFLEATIRSVLLQGYPRLDYRIVDGGSTDGSLRIIERYAPWLSGWTSEPDTGPAQAINRGFRVVRGDVIAWLNSDDRYLPGTLHAVAAAVRAAPDAVAWIGACRSVDASGGFRYVNTPHGLSLPDLADWMGAAWFAQPASLYRRTAVERAGPLDESLQSSFDVDLFLRLAAQGPFHGSEALWAEETIHPAARTSAMPGRSFAELRVVQIRHGYEALALRSLTVELQKLAAYRRMRLVDHIRRSFASKFLGRPWDPSP